MYLNYGSSLIFCPYQIQVRPTETFLTLPSQSTIPFPNPAGNNLSQPVSKLIYVFLAKKMPDDLLKSHQNLDK